MTRALLAAAAIVGAGLVCTTAHAEPTFSTGGACPTNAASRVPDGARQVLLHNSSKVYLAATLYRQIDKANFRYVDADGAERRSEFPDHYQVFVPPGGTGPIGCTKIMIAGGEASQTFVLQHADYFLQMPTDNTEDARRAVGFISDGAGLRLINLHATKTVHVTLGAPAGPARLDLLPQSVSSAVVGKADAGGRPSLTDVSF